MIDFDLLVGVFILIIGLVDAYIYAARKQHLFRKYEPMKKFWGNKAGPVIHFIGYVVVPIICGIIFTLKK